MGSSKPFCMCVTLHACKESHRSYLGWATTRSPTRVTPAPHCFQNPSDAQDAQAETAGGSTRSARDPERYNSQHHSPTRSQHGPEGSCAVGSCAAGTSQDQPSSRHQGPSPTTPRWEGLSPSTGAASKEVGTNPESISARALQ